jgi:hypothetical protein
MKLTRKEFLSSVVTVAAGAAGAAFLVACGGDSGPVDSGPPNCLANGTRVDIAGNHGHVMAVSKTEVTAGVSKMYDISGGAGHRHDVTINANLFAMLQGNTMVTSTSTAGGTDGHTHTITVTCA